MTGRLKTFSNASLRRVFGIALAIYGLGTMSAFGAGPTPIVLYTCAVSACLLVFYQGNPLSLWVAFAAPWLMMLISTIANISDYSRPLDVRTPTLVSFLILLLALFIPRNTLAIRPIVSRNASDRRVALLFVAFLFFSVANIAYSGFLPALRLATEGDSGYRDFGLPSFNGLSNAYANALAVTSFYLWCTRRRKVFFVGYLMVILSFLLLVSRQNLVSVAVESFVVYNLTVKRVSGLAIVTSGALFLSLFALIGNARLGEGSIADLAKIQDGWRWLPDGGVWLYAYSYFNLLNVDNAFQLVAIPPFDMSSVATLIPSVLRPTADADPGQLEVSAFTVGSFIKPVLSDIGWKGLVVVFLGFALWGRSRASALRADTNYRTVCSYSTIYFCFSFSFFENFWFYLPVIFQLAFFKAFDVFLFRQNKDKDLRPRRIRYGVTALSR